MDETTYNHRNKADLFRLREDMSSLNNLQRAAVVVFAFRQGVMKTPLGIKASMSVFSLRYGQEGNGKFAKVLSESSYLKLVFNDLTNWMVDGKDSYDKMSAGGWNKSELQSVVDYMKSILWVPSSQVLHADSGFLPASLHELQACFPSPEYK